MPLSWVAKLVLIITLSVGCKPELGDIRCKESSDSGKKCNDPDSAETDSSTTSNNPPTWVRPLGNFSLSVDEAVANKSAEATSDTGQTLTYSLDSANMTCDNGSWAPPLAIDATSGVLSGTPRTGDAGACTAQILATNGVDVISELITITVIPLGAPIPGVVTNLITAADAAGGSDVRFDDDTDVYLAWAASTESQTGIRDYTVTWYAQAACGGAGTDVTGLAATNYQLTGLASGTTYSFKVVAYSNGGNPSSISSCSGNILIDTSAPTSAASLVTAADATNGADVRSDDDTGIYFTWTAGSDAESGIRDYKVSWYAQANCGGGATDVTGITNVYYNLTGLSSGSTYSFKITTYNNSGLASAQTACSGNILVDGSAPTSASSLVTAADANNGSDVRYDDDTGIYFIWTAGADAESGLRDYTVSWYAQANCGGSATNVTGVTNAYYNLTGLSSGTTYSFKITTYNNVGAASTQTACSGNILIDTSAPTSAASLVTAADANNGADVRYDDDTGVYLIWAAGSDAQSGIRDYTVSWYAQAACGGSATDVTGVTNAYYNLTGLTTNTTYSFKVTTYNNSGLASTQTACSGDILIDTSAPTSASALLTAADASNGADTRNDDDTGVYFVWTAGSDAQSGIRDYTVAWYAQASCGGSATNVTGITNSYYNLTGLSSGSTYSFKVTTYNNSGLASTQTACSGDILIDTGSIVSASNLITAADASNGSDVRYDDDTGVYFAWTAGSDAQSGIRDYTVSWYAQANCGGSATNVTGITATNYNLTGLSSGTTYSFKVNTYNNLGNASGLTACSGDIVIDTSIPTSASSLVTAADANNGADVRYDDDTGVYFIWTAGSDAQSGIRDYTVSWYAQAACGGSATDVTGVTNAYYNLTGLTTNTTYSFKITTYNNSGLASAQTSCSGNILLDTSAPTSASTLVTAADANNGADVRYDDDTGVYFIWTAGSDAQSGIRDYTVSWYAQAACGGSATDVTGVTNAYYNLTGLSSGTTYSFKVTTYNNSGLASAQTSCSGNILLDTSTPTSASTLVTAADANNGPDVRYDDDTGVYFIWTAGSDAQSGIRDYTVSWYAQAACGGSATDVTGVTNAYYNLTGLSSGTTYSFKVTTYNNSGLASAQTSCSGDILLDTSAPTSASSLVTAADANNGADVRYDDDTGVYFIWTAGSDAQSSIRDYTVAWYSQAACGGTATNVTGVTNAYYNLTGLSSGTTYSFKVTTYNNSGLASAQTSCSGNILIDTSAPTSASALVTAADANNGADVRYDDDTGVYFIWTAGSDAQSSIRDYTVAWYSQAACGGTATNVTGVTNAYYNLTGLSSGSTYSFKITTYNNAGLASAQTSCSGNILVDTSAPTSASALITAADANNGADVRTDDDADVFFIWTAGSDAQSSIRDYTVSWYSQAACGGTATDVTGVTTTYYNLGSLSSGTTYSFKITTYNNAGLASAQTSCSGDIAITIVGGSIDCPDGWVLVEEYTDADVGTIPEFCVMKYEAKNVASVATNQATGTPWVSVARGATSSTASSAWKACSDLNSNRPTGGGANLVYDLVSNAQWNSMARQIERAEDPGNPGVYLNWSGGSTAGNNALNRGFSDDPAFPADLGALAASTDDDDGCVGMGSHTHDGSPVADDCGGGWHLNKRTNTFANGTVIWDLNGNVFEWTRDSVDFVYNFLGNWYWATPTTGEECLTPDCTGPQGYPKKAFGPYGNYTGKSSDPYGGLGWGSLNGSGALTIMRGGAYSQTNMSGIFYTVIFWPDNYTAANIGFRCTATVP